MWLCRVVAARSGGQAALLQIWQHACRSLSVHACDAAALLAKSSSPFFPPTCPFASDCPPSSPFPSPLPIAQPQFLLSASMDKTVRLWHISMDECLRVFK
jgi:WD40 repeat protein